MSSVSYRVSCGDGMYKALLLCNSVFPDDPAALPRLRGPARDGLLLWAALVDPARGCFRQDDVEVVFEGSRQDVADAAERFFGEASPRDVLLFYYSGHGRRSSNELMLCCRDTVTLRPIATALMSDALNKMIERSSARVVIVILDCCYSGAFKGQSAIEDDLAGQGRFVIAATSAYEEAQDASEGGTLSPFTAALVAALKGAAVRTDDHVTLEDLSTYLEGPIPGLKSRPRKNFDGTGSVTIARIPNVRDTEALEHRQDHALELQPTAVPVKALENPAHESPAWWRSGNLPSGRRVRARNDYSLGDLTSYRFYGILATAIIAFGIVSAARMNSEFTASEGVIGFNGIAPSCVAAVIAGTVMLIIVFAEWILARRIIRNAPSRRSLLAGYAMGPVRFVRLMRDGCAICAAAIVAYGATRDYGDALYVILLGLLAVPILASATGRLHFGDAASDLQKTCGTGS
jgi:Caspase domain